LFIELKKQTLSFHSGWFCWAFNGWEAASNVSTNTLAIKFENSDKFDPDSAQIPEFLSAKKIYSPQLQLKNQPFLAKKIPTWSINLQIISLWCLWIPDLSNRAIMCWPEKTLPGNLTTFIPWVVRSIASISFSKLCNITENISLGVGRQDQFSKSYLKVKRHRVCLIVFLDPSLILLCASERQNWQLNCPK